MAWLHLLHVLHVALICTAVSCAAYSWDAALLELQQGQNTMDTLRAKYLGGEDACRTTGDDEYQLHFGQVGHAVQGLDLPCTCWSVCHRSTVGHHCCHALTSCHCCCRWPACGC